MVEIKNLTVVIKNQTLLDDVSCSLIPGRISCFIGKSGAGKTTLLKSLVNLMPITSGTISINNKQLAELTYQKKSETIGYVFQDFNLFNNLTVLENCIDPLLVHGMQYKQAEERALQELKKRGLENHVHKYPTQLSGGQQQRAAIARSLCLQPQILLLDEPTASLDPINTQELVTTLQELAAQNLIIGVSSQDMHFVQKIFDRVYYLQAGTIIDFCDDIQKINYVPNIKSFINIA
ncbi:MAG TPA: ATP-binding cassette domain-containing protein [Candidatus Babeliales bacterium]|nr:ATP-binding cassette domain-containing protein [Candidatus Babeliales bacterium]